MMIVLTDLQKYLPTTGVYTGDTMCKFGNKEFDTVSHIIIYDGVTNPRKDALSGLPSISSLPSGGHTISQQAAEWHHKNLSYPSYVSIHSFTPSL